MAVVGVAIFAEKVTPIGIAASSVISAALTVAAVVWAL